MSLWGEGGKKDLRGIRCSLGFQIMNLARPPESRESPTVTFSLVKHWPECCFLYSPASKLDLTHPHVLSAPFEAFVLTNLPLLHFCCKYLKGSLEPKYLIYISVSFEILRFCHLWKDISWPPSHVSLEKLLQRWTQTKDALPPWIWIGVQIGLAFHCCSFSGDPSGFPRWQKCHRLLWGTNLPRPCGFPTHKQMPETVGGGYREI